MGAGLERVVSLQEFLAHISDFKDMKWTDVDMETGASTGNPRQMESQQLRMATGVGFRVVHPINNRSAKIDQFTVRAQPAAPSSK